MKTIQSKSKWMSTSLERGNQNKAAKLNSRMKEYNTQVFKGIVLLRRWRMKPENLILSNKVM